MLVVGTAAATLWFLAIAVALLICPWAIALLGSEMRTFHSDQLLTKVERIVLFGAWAISMLAIGGVFYFGGSYFGEIALIFYKVMAILFAIITLVILLIATSKPE